MLSLYGFTYETTMTAAAFNDGLLHATPSSTLGSGWAIASILPLDDSDGGLAFSTYINLESEEAAIEEHLRLCEQSSVAIEFCEAERLIQVGMEALHRARQRIHRFRLRDT